MNFVVLVLACRPVAYSGTVSTSTTVQLQEYVRSLL